MFTRSCRRRRLGALIGVCTVGILVAAGVSVGTAQAQPQAPAQTQVKVPWAQVGAGWELVQDTGTQFAHPTTLYLVGPTGAKYALRTWAKGSSVPGTLVAWSGDKSRALFFNDDSGRVTQLNLMTGKTNSFSLKGQTSPIAYTQPHGLNILTVQDNSASFTLARYSLTGQLQKVLLRDKGADSAVYNPNGASIAVAGSKGVRLVNNATGAIKNLNIPGLATMSGCTPARWWNSGTILAYCLPKAGLYSRLWLVPANGARPTALTPQRNGTYDLGDVNAWRLSSGLYLQSLGGCGTIEINKQAANGSITPVKVPGTPNTHNAIISADGPRLLIYPSDACQGGSGLLWYNPGTHAETWLFRYPARAGLDVIPFDSIDNGPVF
jgi:hypothetical protein